jgi:hypothetical protein
MGSFLMTFAPAKRVVVLDNWPEPHHHACAKEELYMGILDELLGGGQIQKEYRDFVDRYEQ